MKGTIPAIACRVAAGSFMKELSSSPRSFESGDGSRRRPELELS